MTDENTCPIIAKPEDIDAALATRAFTGTSFDPEKRGQARREQYAAAVNGFYAQLWPKAKTDEQKAALAVEMERFRIGYKDMMPSTILSHQRELGLSPTDVNIIMHLISHWWYADRLPYPSKKKLADCMSIHKSTVQRRIRRMEGMGLIKRHIRKDRVKGQQTNYYDLAGLVSTATPMAKKDLVEKEKELARRGKPDLKLVK